MIRVQSEDFDIGAEIRELTHNKHNIGGVCSFVGLVRDVADGDQIENLMLEHYPGMTEKLLESIETEAKKRWPIVDSLIIHRFGLLAPGDQIVLVCVSSAHRKAAIEACQFLIDWLKTKAPFWKYESGANISKWVEERDQDIQKSKMWEKVK